MDDNLLHDHVAASLSDLDLEMVRAVPPGGNWTDIPETIPSKRLDQIRRSAEKRGGVVRTTYYGRLDPGAASYTISTYFNRPGNGCNIHPHQDRTLTIREAARLQSFPDRVAFAGSQAARRRQVGNAVPVLLARAIGTLFEPTEVVDLFAGAGGLSHGLSLAGHRVSVAADSDEQSLQVHAQLDPNARHVVGNIDSPATRQRIREGATRPGLVVGGPPCQGWSYAGWHDHSDSRNKLVWSFIELLQELEPNAFVMENVQGLLWMADGAALHAIEQAMVEAGYNVTHFVLNAADFGVPQKRKRVFIVGTDEGTPPSVPAPLFTESRTDLFLPHYITVQEAIGDLPPVDAGCGEDPREWHPPETNVTYRRWCRGEITFDQMHELVTDGIGRL